jgi:PEGA domain
MPGKSAGLVLMGALVISSFTGCQTLSRGRSQLVPVTSRPAGVNVVVDGTMSGRTPVNLKLARRSGHVIRFEMDGYRPIEVRVTQKRPPLGETILTSFWWGPVGAVVLGMPIYLVLNEAFKPEEDLAGLGSAMISGAAGFVTGWIIGTIVDSRLPANFNLLPQTLFIEMEKADGTSLPLVVQVGPGEASRVRWIRVALREE